METGINLYAGLPYREVIDAFCKNGIGNTFVVADHPELCGAMECLRKNNIKVESLHAPYRCGEYTVNDMWNGGAEGEQMLEKLRHCIDLCDSYGVGVLVAHASTGRPMPPITDDGTARFGRLFDYAREKEITVAFENHKFIENTSHIMNTFPDAGFCWDVGHEACFTDGIDYMSLWKDRLSVVHISDSECIPDTDKHLIPYDGKIDFQKVAEKIAGCKCALMLELKPGNDARYKNLSVMEYYTLAAQRAEKLLKEVNKLEKKIR